MNIRIDREGVRLRLSADEARTLMQQQELVETEAVVRFGVKLVDDAPSLDGLVARVPRVAWEHALRRIGAKDAGVYAPGLAVEIDSFTR